MVGTSGEKKLNLPIHIRQVHVNTQAVLQFTSLAKNAPLD